MNMIRYNPQRLFDFPFERIFDDFLPRSQGEAPTESVYQPRVDIIDEKDAVIVSAELPGVDKNNISIELENRVLTLSAEKKSELKEEKDGFYRSERVYGTFQRSFRVPEVVNPDEISADYSNGVLKVTLPKRPEAAPRQIEIKGESGAVKQIETK